MLTRRSALKAFLASALLAVVTACQRALGIEAPSPTAAPSQTPAPPTPTPPPSATAPPTPTYGRVCGVNDPCLDLTKPAPTITPTPDLAALIAKIAFLEKETALYLIPPGVSLPADGTLPKGALPATPPSGANLFWTLKPPAAGWQAVRLVLKPDPAALANLGAADQRWLLELLAAALRLEAYIWRKDNSFPAADRMAQAVFRVNLSNALYADLRLQDWPAAPLYAAWTLRALRGGQDALAPLPLYLVPATTPTPVKPTTSAGSTGSSASPTAEPVFCSPGGPCVGAVTGDDGGG